jgi:transposase-like protein
MGKRTRHTTDQIILKLREADSLAARGLDIAQICQKLEVSAATLHRWRNQFGGIKQEDMRELRRLQEENRRLKKIVADQLLDIEGLKHINRGNW